MPKSLHEKPWGSRLAYTGGEISNVNVVGPGLKVMSKAEIDANRPKVSAEALLVERAALAGMSVAEFKSSGLAKKDDGQDLLRGHQSTEYAQPRKRSHGAGGADAWYYIDNSGTQQGPFPLASLQHWYSAGQIPPSTKVKKGEDGILREAGCSVAVSQQSLEEVQAARRKASSARHAGGQHKLYVGNIGALTEEDLRAVFTEHGVVQDVWLPSAGSEAGESERKSRGFAFVVLETQEQADKAAKALDGSKLGGRTLRVNMAHGKRKAEESAQPDAEVGGLAVDGMYGGDAGPLGAWVEMTDATSGKRTGLPSLFPDHVDLAPADTHTWLSLPPSFPSLPAAPPSLALIFA